MKQPWRMSSERWKELLADAVSAGYTFHPDEMTRIYNTVYVPKRLERAVKVALFSLGGGRAAA